MSGRVIGIDLGTSNSVVAAMVRGEPVVIPSRDGDPIVPSVVSFLPDGHVVVGQKAKTRRLVDPLNTVYSVKRLIGRPFYAPEVKRFMEKYPFRIVRGEDDNPKIVAHGRQYAVEEVQAIILRKLKNDAELYLGESVDQAVITVPANFNEAQRYATKVAGELAGLEVLRILNEPTAAALAYGYGRRGREVVAIYDFGGGTFDITILEMRGQVFEVLSTAGNTFLGGDDFDNRLVDHMISRFNAEHAYDLSADIVAMQRMKAIAERLKCELSDRELVEVKLQELIPGASTP
ncbi:MAG: Hsp70 family protein, partial [Myxococcales bacterium]|nr:Hsp70 family protein [Myxococcales bacterium]